MSTLLKRASAIRDKIYGMDHTNRTPRNIVDAMAEVIDLLADVIAEAERVERRQSARVADVVGCLAEGIDPT